MTMLSSLDAPPTPPLEWTRRIHRNNSKPSLLSPTETTMSPMSASWWHIWQSHVQSNWSKSVFWWEKHLVICHIDHTGIHWNSSAGPVEQTMQFPNEEIDSLALLLLRMKQAWWLADRWHQASCMFLSSASMTKGGMASLHRHCHLPKPNNLWWRRHTRKCLLHDVSQAQTCSQAWVIADATGTWHSDTDIVFDWLHRTDSKYRYQRLKRFYL